MINRSVELRRESRIIVPPLCNGNQRIRGKACGSFRCGRNPDNTLEKYIYFRYYCCKETENITHQQFALKKCVSHMLQSRVCNIIVISGTGTWVFGLIRYQYRVADGPAFAKIA